MTKSDECAQDYPQEPLHVCETCFGPLEIVYDYAAIGKNISGEKIAAGDKIFGATASCCRSTESRRLDCTLATLHWSRREEWKSR